LVYVADTLHDRVVSLTGHFAEQAQLPLSGLTRPSAVAVDGAGGIFVIDQENERVLKLPWTATVATVLPYAVGRPEFVAVDASLDLYVTDSRDNRVMRLNKVTNTAIALPFDGLNRPQGVAVDSSGNVYVVDAGNNRVLKLPPGELT
jgi:serine/threonine protein kinase, bacterial